MNQELDDVLHDFQLRAYGEELTRVNQLPVRQRRLYVRALWENSIKRSSDDQRVGWLMEFDPEPPESES